MSPSERSSTKSTASNPIAVVISDIHFNLNTLEIASKALKAAITKAEDLDVPLVIAGDLQDTKAIIRGEVANRLIDLIRTSTCRVYILVGNHDLINEKGTENSLNYLRPYVNLVSAPQSLKHFVLLPYMSSPPNEFKFEPGRILIMHQGFLGAQMGDYIQDKSSISPDLVKDYTVISGHYHRHQTLGTVTYIGSPYTITFGEATDGPKGFLVLNEDGTFTREILKLRKHIIFNWELVYNLDTKTNEFIKDKDESEANPGDIIWLKITGQRSLLNKLNKKVLGESLFGHSNFKLDLIPLESSKTESTQKTETRTDVEVLDALIDNLDDSETHKTYLKELYHEIIEG